MIIGAHPLLGPTVFVLLAALSAMLTFFSSAVLVAPAVRWLAPGHSFAAFEERITRRASFGFVLLLQLALPSEIPGYVLGLVRYPPGRYLAALAIAELPYVVGTMLLGQSFVERRIALFISLGAVAAATGALLVRALRRRMR